MSLFSLSLNHWKWLLHFQYVFQSLAFLRVNRRGNVFEVEKARWLIGNEHIHFSNEYHVFLFQLERTRENPKKKGEFCPISHRDKAFQNQSDILNVVVLSEIIWDRPKDSSTVETPQLLQDRETSRYVSHLECARLIHDSFSTLITHSFFLRFSYCCSFVFLLLFFVYAKV